MLWHAAPMLWAIVVFPTWRGTSNPTAGAIMAHIPDLQGCENAARLSRLLASVRGFVAVRVVHGLSMKFLAMFDWMLAARWQTPVVALPKI